MSKQIAMIPREETIQDNEVVSLRLDARILPPGWKKAKLADWLEENKIFLKNGFPQGGFNQDGQGIPHLSPFNVTVDGLMDLSQIKYVENVADNSSYLLQPNDVIFNNTNSEDLVGKTSYFSLDGKFVLSNHMTIIRVLDKNLIDALWFALSLQYWWRLGVFKAICRRHVGQASISTERLCRLSILCPPIPEQRAIAHILQTVQQAIQTRRKELELERERKAALMQHLFTYGTSDNTIAARETKFGRSPEHWIIEPLEVCAFVQNGIAKGRKFKNEKTLAIPYLRVANVQDGYLDLSEIKTIEILEAEIEQYRLQSGDVVVTEGGDFDKLGRGFIWNGQITDCVHQNHIFAIRVDREKLHPEYLAYLIQSKYGKNYFLSVAHKTTNLACINSTKLKAFPTLLPNLDEQRVIIHILQACDTKIAALKKEIALHEELFRALLDELMTGRISTLPLVKQLEKGSSHDGSRTRDGTATAD